MTRRVSKRPLAVAASLLALTALAACENAPIDKRTQGQIVGGATGAAVGSLFGSGSGQAVAIGAGAVAGAIVGGNVADGM
ncbi:MAG: glycine zipper 2TM domain-containing protein [Pseudomonadota bacterium]